MTRVARGFTLVELLVAVVIASILMAIAVPGYRTYVQRTQRTEARQALTQARAAQERFFLQYNRYAGTLQESPPAGLGLPAITQNGLYDMTVALTAGGFRLEARARPDGGQRDDARCVALSIDESGLRSAANADGLDTTEECWR